MTPSGVKWDMHTDDSGTLYRDPNFANSELIGLAIEGSKPDFRGNYSAEQGGASTMFHAGSDHLLKVGHTDDLSPHESSLHVGLHGLRASLSLKHGLEIVAQEPPLTRRQQRIDAQRPYIFKGVDVLAVYIPTIDTVDILEPPRPTWLMKKAGGYALSFNNELERLATQTYDRALDTVGLDPESVWYDMTPENHRIDTSQPDRIIVTKLDTTALRHIEF